ncbi:hypothetical protein QR680_001335 [Steinernema hermaphroditum]|uniref:ShKT domain-containing protein n=1 Tax=Steinernema hermaphroditum TaxID=289476 RepID=A0AA39GXU4_9BILA|nr:hypothetical protein QR680_001335 [Steinernema hermaphroditum]
MDDFRRVSHRQPRRQRCYGLLAVMLLLNLGATGAILFFTVSYRFAFGGPTRANLTLPSGVDVSDITFAVAMSTGRDIKDENSLEEITAEDIDVAVRFLRRLLRMQSNIQLLQKISNMTATTKLMEPTTLAPKEESSVNDKDDYVNVVDGATDGSEFHYVAKNILQKSKNPSVADENVERSTGEAIESTTSGEDADPSVTTTTPQATGKSVMDCAVEKNLEDRHKCTAWSKAGYCRTHAATRLIFCRHECYCSNLAA